jgi:hypothetical protein
MSFVAPITVGYDEYEDEESEVYQHEGAERDSQDYAEDRPDAAGAAMA